MFAKLDLSQAYQLQGIPQISVYLDILITGQTEAEHLRRLDEVLARLEESGLCLNQTSVHSWPNLSILGPLN